MNSKSMSITALVCGIVGIVGAFIPGVEYVAPFAAIAGIVFGALALDRFKKGDESGSKGLAIAGLVLGIVATAFSLLMVICAACALLACAGFAGALGSM